MDPSAGGRSWGCWSCGWRRWGRRCTSSGAGGPCTSLRSRCSGKHGARAGSGPCPANQSRRSSKWSRYPLGENGGLGQLVGLGRFETRRRQEFGCRAQLGLGWHATVVGHLVVWQASECGPFASLFGLSKGRRPPTAATPWGLSGLQDSAGGKGWQDGGGVHLSAPSWAAVG